MSDLALRHRLRATHIPLSLITIRKFDRLRSEVTHAPGRCGSNQRQALVKYRQTAIFL